MFKESLDILWVLVVLVVAGGIVWFLPEPGKSRGAQLGGWAFLLWLLIQIAKYLVQHG